MIDYTDAKKIAQEKKPDVNSVLEYTDAFIFYNSKARGNKQDDNEVVVLKKNGEVISMSHYVIATKDTGEPKRIKF